MKYGTVLDMLEVAFRANNALEEEVNELKRIGRKLRGNENALIQEVAKLKKDNHALQLFIEEHVDEETKKLIFKQV